MMHAFFCVLWIGQINRDFRTQRESERTYGQYDLEKTTILFSWMTRFTKASEVSEAAAAAEGREAKEITDMEHSSNSNSICMGIAIAVAWDGERSSRRMEENKGKSFLFTSL